MPLDMVSIRTFEYDELTSGHCEHTSGHYEHTSGYYEHTTEYHEDTSEYYEHASRSVSYIPLLYSEYIFGSPG